MANKSMTPKSMGYGCGGKVKKHNTGGDLHISKKPIKMEEACCASHLGMKGEMYKRNGKR